MENAERKIEAPFIEIEKAKELWFDETNKIQLNHGNNPYRFLSAMGELLTKIYNTAFASGYNQHIVDSAVNGIHDNEHHGNE